MIGPVVLETGSFLPQNGPTKFCALNVGFLKREFLPLILIADNKNIYNHLQAASNIHSAVQKF